MKKKLHDCVLTLLADRDCVLIKRGMGVETFNGLNIENNTTADVYVLILKTVPGEEYIDD